MAGEQDLEQLTEEEEAAFKATPPMDDEEEPETAPGEKTAETEPLPEEKEEVSKPETKVEPEPEKKEEKPPTIDGIIARDGKNYIPYNVLEEERTAKKVALEEKQRLEAENAELKKKVAEPAPKKKEPEPTPKEEPAFDLDAFAKEVAKKTYASEDDAVEAIKNLIVTISEKASKVGAEAAVNATAQAEFKKEASRIKTANPWIKPGVMEAAIAFRAKELIAEREIANDDFAGTVQAAEDAVAEAKIQFRVDEPKIDRQAEINKAVKVAVEKNTNEILAKFNLKQESGVKTLGNIKNLNPDVVSKFDELDKLNGIDFEEAFAQLSPEEKEKFLERTR